MSHPLKALCLSYCAGILLASYTRISFLIFYLAAVLFLLISAFFVRYDLRFRVMILAAVFFLGGVSLKNAQVLPPCHVYHFTHYKGRPVGVFGVIGSEPVYGQKHTSFVLNAQQIETAGGRYKTCGRTLVKAFGRSGFSYGDKLFLEGMLYRPFSFSKTFDYRKYLKHQGIYSILSVAKNRSVTRLGRETGNPLRLLAYGLKRNMEGVINKNLSGSAAAVLNAMMLGQRQHVPPEARDAFVKSGTVHILSISGMHIGIVVFMLLLFLKTLRLPLRLRYPVTIFFLIVYCVLTGARTPVIRATIMASAVLFGYVFEREVNIYDSLSLAALLILAFNPWQLFEVSFQLSFVSVLSIVYLTPKLKPVFPEAFYRRRWLRCVIIACLASLAAWIGLLPLIAHYFKIIAPVTVIANMIIVPYMGLLMASGFAFVLIGLLVPFLAPLLAESCQFLVWLLFKINALLISIPGAYIEIGHLPGAYIVVYYILIISLLNMRNLKKNDMMIP